MPMATIVYPPEKRDEHSKDCTKSLLHAFTFQTQVEALSLFWTYTWVQVEFLDRPKTQEQETKFNLYLENKPHLRLLLEFVHNFFR